MALPTQKVEADTPLLAVDADYESHIMGELAAATSGADTFGEVKAYLSLGIVH